jgi:hypothetical protein
VHSPCTEPQLGGGGSRARAGRVHRGRGIDHRGEPLGPVRCRSRSGRGGRVAVAAAGCRTRARRGMPGLGVGRLLTAFLLSSAVFGSSRTSASHRRCSLMHRARPHLACGGTSQVGGDVAQHFHRPLQGGLPAASADLSLPMTDAYRRAGVAGEGHAYRDASPVTRLLLGECLQQCVQVRDGHAPRRYRETQRQALNG